MLEGLSGAPLWFMIPFTLVSILAWFIFLRIDGVMIENGKKWYLVLLYPLLLPGGAIGCLIGITVASKVTYGKWWWSDRL